jgi:hypothetical protein
VREKLKMRDRDKGREREGEGEGERSISISGMQFRRRQVGEGSSTLMGEEGQCFFHPSFRREGRLCGKDEKYSSLPFILLGSQELMDFSYAN